MFERQGPQRPYLTICDMELLLFALRTPLQPQSKLIAIASFSIVAGRSIPRCKSYHPRSMIPSSAIEPLQPRHPFRGPPSFSSRWLQRSGTLPPALHHSMEAGPGPGTGFFTNRKSGPSESMHLPVASRRGWLSLAKTDIMPGHGYRNAQMRESRYRSF